VLSWFDSFFGNIWHSVNKILGRKEKPKYYGDCDSRRNVCNLIESCFKQITELYQSMLLMTQFPMNSNQCHTSDYNSKIPLLVEYFAYNELSKLKTSINPESL
jgi:hypothetical protein